MNWFYQSLPLLLYEDVCLTWDEIVKIVSMDIPVLYINTYQTHLAKHVIVSLIPLNIMVDNNILYFIILHLLILNQSYYIIMKLYFIVKLFKQLSSSLYKIIRRQTGWNSYYLWMESCAYLMDEDILHHLYISWGYSCLLLEKYQSMT